MNLRNLILVTGVAALLFSLGDILAAGTLANLLGGQINSFAIGQVQIRGAVGLLYVFLAFFSRNDDERTLRQVVGPTMMWGFVAQFVAILYLLLIGAMNPTGWIFLLLGAIFISAYVYLLYVRPAPMARAAGR